jgi:hypothetical protein
VQTLCLIHFYKPSTQLIFIINTGGEGPQLPFSEKFSRTLSQNPNNISDINITITNAFSENPN